MRKHFGLAVAAFALVALSTAVRADDWQTWEDNKFGLTFELPSTFKEMENTEETFVAGGDTFVFAIVNWKDASLTSEQAIDAALQEICGLDVQAVQGFEKRDFGGDTEGYELIGSAKIEGEDCEFGVLAIIDKASARNIVVYTFYKGSLDGVVTERRIIESIKIKSA